MNDAVWIALITALPPTLAAVCALVVALRNGKKVDECKQEVKAEVRTIARVAERLPDELELLKTGAHWRGYLEGEQAEKQRASNFGALDRSAWKG